MAATSDENAALIEGTKQNATTGEPQQRSAESDEKKNADFGRKMRSLSDAGALVRSIRDVSNHSLDERRRNSEAGLSKVLLKHIRSLAGTEKELQEREERQRLENLVQKVEDEVEYEGILEDMCSRVRAEDEAMEMERREREWEFERREVRLEEEVEVLKGKIRKLEEELRVSQVEKNYLMQRKQDDVEEVVQRLLCELKDDESLKSMFRDEQIEEQIKSLFSAAEEDASQFRSQEVLSAFEDMLREADERHEREKRLLESTIRAKEEAAEALRHDRQKLRVRENQLQGQVLMLEKEVARMSSLLREKDASLVAERDRRKDLQDEAERFSSMLKEERGAQKVAVAKLKKLESGMQKLKEKVTRDSAEVCRDIEKELIRLLHIFSQKKEVPRTEAKQLEIVSRQLDAAVADRDKLEEKLNLLLKRSRDREAEIDTMWLERERILIEKIADAEEQAEKWEKKCRRAEAELLNQQRTWELSTRHVLSEEETRALEAVIREQEARHKEEEERLSCLLEAKDCELQALKAMQRKLLNALALNKKRVDEMKELVGQRGTSTQLRSQMSESIGPEGSEAESCIDIEGVATDMELELSRLSQDMKNKEEQLEKDRDELKACAERLRLQKEELEKEVAESLETVAQLKRELASKDSQLERQRGQIEAAASVKAAEVEILRKKIEAKGLEMDARVERFRSEMNMMQQEVESERRERERLMDIHLAIQQKMNTEVKIKEEVWEKDMERTMQELTSLRVELRKKNEDLETLTKERVEQELNLAEERRNWVIAEKEQESEICRLRQENLELLQKLREIGIDFEAASEFDSVWSARESTDERRNAEWQLALEKVAVFDKQITEAMRSIQSLREELAAKEAELLKARTEPEGGCEKREEKYEKERERQQAEWRKREEELLAEKAELLKLLETERSEAADGIACLRGTVRELRWSLMQKEEEFLDNLENNKHLKEAKDGGMIKVHANHFKDVDQYICDLKSKLAELEKQLTIAKGANKMEPGLAEACLDGSRLMLADERPGSSTLRSYGRSLIKSQHDQPWHCESPLSCLHKFSDQDILPSSVAVQRQKKWIVDASWMEQVRKEHFILTQQLMIERQRVAALGQAEADRRCMEAMMLRALEQQKESEIKLLQLQEKVSLKDLR